MGKTRADCLVSYYQLMSLTSQEITDISDQISILIKQSLDDLQAQLDKINEMYQMMGLDAMHSMTITKSKKTSGTIAQDTNLDYNTKTQTITRE